MTLGEEEVLRYVTGWDGAYGTRIVAALFGLLLLFVIFRGLLKRDVGILAAVLGLLAGGLATVFALIPQRVVDLVISTPYDARVRILIGGISFIVILITLESIRRTHLQERYALLWVATGVVILVFVLFPKTVVLFRMLTGMKYTQALTAVAFTFLVLVAFHFSISISSSRSNQARIAQRIAILEERLRRVEKDGGESPGPAGDEAVDEPSTRGVTKDG